MTSIPTVSIIMPAFNAASTIGESIESVKAQTLKDWELIIVDDGSSDRTAAVAQAYARADARICVIERCNRGPSVATGSPTQPSAFFTTAATPGSRSSASAAAWPASLILRHVF